ncbi:ABC transporter ATP-binding protein [Taklimakanibacter deserti]|uniref:ABC transporter ATP-binding protein n=1 Tax=Taklimakanibacter deserti TaxID=2267839 RepID=UPI000E6466E1
MTDRRSDPLLKVENLSVAFGPARAVDGISFAVTQGEMLGLVGESGCGKSTTALALMRLLRDASLGGSARLDGVDLLALDEAAMRERRGAAVGMIFQDPATALHPMIRVGDQIVEALEAHLHLPRDEARRRAIDLLRKVGIAAPEERFSVYPHEMSGGMCQRVVIAMAMACSPKLLLADEPTTALDVTVQAQILDLLRGLAREAGMGVILITHDLGVVAGMTDRVAVMYAGEIVEMAATEELFARPAHPYTLGLLRSIPQLDSGWDEPVPTIPGSVQGAERQTGCRFAPRCAKASEACRVPPSLRDIGDGHSIACWNAP